MMILFKTQSNGWSENINKILYLDVHLIRIQINTEYNKKFKLFERKWKDFSNKNNKK